MSSSSGVSRLKKKAAQSKSQRKKPIKKKGY